MNEIKYKEIMVYEENYIYGKSWCSKEIIVHEGSNGRINSESNTTMLSIQRLE
jgi:hypothetical protein